MQLRTKIILVSALLATKVVISACDIGETSTSTSSGSSGSTGGTALAFGGYNYNFECSSFGGGSNTVPIPPTSSSSCARVYENYSLVFGCNLIDDMASAQAQYESCLAQDIAACASASSSDPNC